MNLRSVLSLTSIGIALSLVSCRDNAPTRIPDSRGDTIPSPSAESPLSLGIVPRRQGPFLPGAPIEFEVSIVNRTGLPVVICNPRWVLPRGVLSFRVYDQANREVRVRSTRYPRFALTREDDLRLLAPGGTLSGILDLTEYETEYSFTAGDYSVLAVYFCPFDGIQDLDGQEAVVAGNVQVSVPVSIRVEYE